MTDVLGYAGKRVVVTGAASGMGAAAAELLVDLGAEVHALDIADVKAPVHRFVRTDMASRESIDAALAALPAEIDARFNCAGVPHPPFPAVDTVMINFVGLRHLTDAVIPRLRAGGSITSIASTALSSSRCRSSRAATMLAVAWTRVIGSRFAARAAGNADFG